MRLFKKFKALIYINTPKKLRGFVSIILYSNKKYKDILPFKVDPSTFEPHTKGFFVKDEEELARLGWSRIGIIDELEVKKESFGTVSIGTRVKTNQSKEPRFISLK
jgi:hypothetical protein